MAKKVWYERIYARDVIAAMLLVGCFYLISLGYNSWLHGLVALIVGYYFSKRVYEEQNA